MELISHFSSNQTLKSRADINVLRLFFFTVDDEKKTIYTEMRNYVVFFFSIMFLLIHKAKKPQTLQIEKN